MMGNKPEAELSKKQTAWLPIILCWLVYVAAYLGRYSYASNITAVMDAYAISHADAGLVSTCFFFAYGIGQLVHGFMCKHYNKHIIIPTALGISSVLNFLIYSGIPFPFIKYLWMINGLVQSILWPSLIYILAQTLSARDLGKATILMSTTTSAGTFLSYGCSSLMAIFDRYTLSFLIGAIVMGVAAIGWYLMYKKAFTNARAVEERKQLEQIRRKPDSAAIVVIVVLCLLAVVNNLVKDGVTTWIPSILKENFDLQESLSIFLSLLLPILGAFGGIFSTLFEKKVKSFTTTSGIFYGITSLCMVGVLLFINSSHWYVVLVLFGAISLFMHGVNNLITTLAPLGMREKMNSGMLAGILNGCCYVGSTISSYGLGSVADNFGWNGVFWLLLMVSIVSVGISVAGTLLSRPRK